MAPSHNPVFNVKSCVMSSDPSFQLPNVDQIPGLTHDQLTEHVRLARANVGLYQDLLPYLRTELEERTPERNYRCMKCGHQAFDTREIRAADGGLSSFFGVEPSRYRALVCQRCKFTELYHGDAHIAQQALDFLFGG